MHSATIVFALACVAATSAVGLVNDIHANPAYKYSYAVADKVTGDQKSQAEVRDGGVTKGTYSLVQPDGVLRTVNYIVTPHGGFQAQVLNNGVAAHPAVLGKGLVGGVGVAAPAVGLGLGAGRLGLGLGGATSVVGGLGLNGGLGLGLGAGRLGLGLGALGGLGGATSVVGSSGLGLGAGSLGGLGLGLGLNGGLGLGLGAGLL